MANIYTDDEDLTQHYRVSSSLTAPIEVGDIGITRAGSSVFFAWPPLAPLLFENEGSDARDHCANERTFLSYLRISVTMAIVSMAITLSFHLKHQPTAYELRVAKPLGLMFWGLSVLMLGLGLVNYIRTVNQYGRRVAIVQTGWKTQVILGILATCIVVTCIVLLLVERTNSREQSLLGALVF